MQFNTLQFLIFFLVVYGLYCFFNHRWQNRLLIVASCIFYGTWNYKFLVLMLVSISTDYFCAKRIAVSQNPRTRKWYLYLSLLVNLSILGFFKYFNFFLENVYGLLKALHLTSGSTHQILDILLPIGISFYTFEAISYTVDVYRGVIKPARSFSDYLLFIVYFPHLVAGPILRAKTFLPQISMPRVLTLTDFYEGCFLIGWGFFEKVFVADNLAKIVNPIFASYPPYESWQVIVAMYAFAFQIFCDFDGYSNIARGLGKCMGFDIPINFRLPYFSTNPQEFWQRWHISLSTWLRDYLYIPLGGNRQGAVRMCCALLITMLLGGLWHGASLTFVLWGIYHGLLLIVYRFLIPKLKRIWTPSTQWGQNISWVLRVILFFHLTCMGWLIFRATSFDQLGQMLYALVDIGRIDIFLGNVLNLGNSFFFFVFLLIIVQLLQLWKDDLNAIRKLNFGIKALIYYLCALLIILFGVTGAQEFIYFQF